MDVLEILKNLFEVDGCIFVLAIDYNVVFQGLEGKFAGRTDGSERNFHSFFHKIIQLPFSMPVAGYEIGNYLDSMLKNVGYYIEQELNEALEKPAANALKGILLDAPDEDEAETQELKVRHLLRTMVKLSTSKNPRSVKRLVNSLSLIKSIMNEKGEELRSEQKMLCFGVVCTQIAYPRIYEMFLAQPDFVGKWNKVFARSQDLPPLDAPPEKMAASDDWEEWELWQRIAYLAVQNESWMRAQFYNIFRLLTLLSACVPPDKLGRNMKVVLALTATTGTSSATPQENRLSRSEFLTSIHDNAARTLMESFFDELDRMFLKHDVLDEEYPSRAVARVRVKHASNLDLLLRIKTDGQKVERQIQESSDPKYRSFQNLTQDEIQQGSSFFKELLKVYNELTTGDYALF